MKELWVDKYRPNKLEGYVWRDAAQRRQVESWIKEKSIPHLLLSGTPGIGKTTMGLMLVNEIIWFKMGQEQVQIKKIIKGCCEAV